MPHIGNDIELRGLYPAVYRPRPFDQSSLKKSARLSLCPLAAPSSARARNESQEKTREASAVSRGAKISFYPGSLRPLAVV